MGSRWCKILIETMVTFRTGYQNLNTDKNLEIFRELRSIEIKFNAEYVSFPVPFFIREKLNTVCQKE